MIHVITILILLSSLTFAQTLKTMKSGAAAISFAIENGGKSLSKAQQADFLTYSTTTRGFLMGLKVSNLLNGGKESRYSTKPDAWMLNPAKSAPSFLAFVSKHSKEDLDDTKVSGDGMAMLLLAWYVKSHSTYEPKRDKEFLQILIDETLQNPRIK